MTKNYMRFGSVLLVVMAIAALSGCGDDSGDEGNAGTSGDGGGGGSGGSGGDGGSGTGGDGGSGTGGDGGGGTGGGGSGGTGGDPEITEAQCITMTETAMPMVPATCAPCLCAADVGVAKCNANCWALLGCAGAACGDLVDPERTACVTDMCGAQIALPGAAVGARELGAALMSCGAECGGGMEDAGSN